MSEIEIGRDDWNAILEHGISGDDAKSQVELLRKPPGFTKLERPCVPGDGIRVLTEAEKREALRWYEEARDGNRLQKLVPASGAATRMFQSLLQFLGSDEIISRAECVERAGNGDDAAADILTFMDGLDKFAFIADLRSVTGKAGHDLDNLRTSFSYKPILTALLTPEGLGFAELPKGLIPFHRESGRARTPFEEHLLEATLYARNRNETCRLHFTVSPEHRDRFEKLLADAAPKLQEETGVRFEVDFSVQKPSTDTVAIDDGGEIFREGDGSPLFRPGGHGALIENLNDFSGDIVLIKNIDNVSPNQLGESCVEWKRVIAGFTAQVQSRLFHYLNQIQAGEDNDNLLDEAIDYLASELGVSPAPGVDLHDSDNRRHWLMEKLDRPVRVCGMVKNEGDPGGGPFWVRDRTGELSIQIVESAQVNREDSSQESILKGATHFNPVDLACGIRNHQGIPFDLTLFVDPETVFISEKSRHGRRLTALERPGLWNGAMARWITVFVEVPSSSFSPVKKVVDLLSDVHQTEDAS